MRGYLSFRMAYRHVRARLGRVALSVVAIGLGVALVVAVRMMNAAVLDAFLRTVDAAAGRAALAVTAGEGAAFSEDVVGRVAAVAGVKLAVPLVTGVAFPDDGSGELLTVQGVDLLQEGAVRLYEAVGVSGQVIEEPLVFLSQADSILLGREFADSRGLTAGERISLVTPGGVKEFTIRGLLEAQGLARTLRGRVVVMDLYAAERAFTADGEINRIDLVPDDGVGVRELKAAVAAVLPGGLRVEEPAVRKHMLGRMVGGVQVVLAGFGLLAAVAGFVICYGRLGTVFQART